ncbi:hypothetical protein TNCV_4607041 [Trichonephila clavipes]|nr:hypothetical protein TNCV_4607041 [Trichonephila clavipes]
MKSAAIPMFTANHSVLQAMTRDEYYYKRRSGVRVSRSSTCFQYKSAEVEVKILMWEWVECYPVATEIYTFPSGISSLMVIGLRTRYRRCRIAGTSTDATENTPYRGVDEPHSH